MECNRKLNYRHHVGRLAPRCLAFGFEKNAFRELNEEDVVNKWFLVGDPDKADFTKYLAGKYGRKTENFMPACLKEARKVQLGFQVLFD